MVLAIQTSRKTYGRAPVGHFSLDKDHWQAQGLTSWVASYHPTTTFQQVYDLSENGLGVSTPSGTADLEVRAPYGNAMFTTDGGANGWRHDDTEHLVSTEPWTVTWCSYLDTFGDQYPNVSVWRVSDAANLTIGYSNAASYQDLYWGIRTGAIRRQSVINRVSVVGAWHRGVLTYNGGGLATEANWSVYLNGETLNTNDEAGGFAAPPDFNQFGRQGSTAEFVGAAIEFRSYGRKEWTAQEALAWSGVPDEYFGLAWQSRRTWFFPTAAGTTTRVFVPTGGMTLGNEVNWTRLANLVPTGGLNFANEVNWLRSKLFTPAGGMTLAGQVDWLRTRVFRVQLSGGGGLSFGGKVDWVVTAITTRVFSPTGGLNFGGKVNWTIPGVTFGLKRLVRAVCSAIGYNPARGVDEKK